MRSSRLNPTVTTTEVATGYVPNNALAAEQIRTADATAMRNWYAALAGRDYAPARILTIGDSRIEGQGTTVALGNRSIDRMLKQLKARFPTAGNPVGPPTNYYPVVYVSPTLTSKWTTTGSPLISTTSFGLGGRCARLAAGQVAQFIGQFTSAKIAWTQTTAASSFRWRVDGGSWSTVTSSGAILEDGHTTAIGPLSSASHTVDVEEVTGTVYLDGIHVYDGDELAGIQLYDSGHHGSRSGASGYNNNTNLTQVISSVNPHCVMINFGTNDHGNNIDPAVYQTNMEAIITAISAGCTITPTFVLVAESGRSSGFTYPWSDYVTRMRALVAADPTHRTLLDLSLRMPPLSDSSLSIWYDSLHENNKGQAFKSDVFASFLSPR